MGVKPMTPLSGSVTTFAPAAQVTAGVGCATLITETEPVDVSDHVPLSAAAAPAGPLTASVAAPATARTCAVLRGNDICFLPSRRNAPPAHLMDAPPHRRRYVRFGAAPGRTWHTL
ncbi:exported hypothetical protein [Actinacidiphila cocklensis]|uniref:Uncharacterized protein n=1 Tax=Actinacidiphila cocklensis TaxID=887465 RepID=A0A9W4DX50_9ACTN|nr:exported hypothetical protein [Actinacidiphila cocklensis]